MHFCVMSNRKTVWLLLLCASDFGLNDAVVKKHHIQRIYTIHPTK